MRFEIEIDREAGNGRWIAEVPELPGCIVHGQSEAEARFKVQALALRVLADRLEHGEAGPELVDISFAAHRHPSLKGNGFTDEDPPVEYTGSLFERLRVAPADLEHVCAEFQVAELSLFGSALRSDFRLDSDVDVLVTFLPEADVGLLELAGLQIRLGELFRRKVDLVPKAGLKPLVAQEVLPAARVIYAAGRAVPPGHPGRE